MNHEIAPQSSAVMSAEDMQKSVDRMNQVREVMNKYVEQNLTAGVDFGKIHIGKDCANKYSPQNCKVESHFSKPSLFKPGSEKMCTLFQIRPVFKLDQEAREMAGSPTGTFFYLCELVGHDGRVWGEGRGSCSIDTRRDSNSAVKIAEKRAQVDAILRTFAMSDRFTQDLEDMDVIDGMKKKEDKPALPKPAVPAVKPKGALLSQGQKDRIDILIKEIGANRETVEAWIFGEHRSRSTGLSPEAADKVIKALTARRDAPKPAQEPVEPKPKVELPPLVEAEIVTEPKAAPWDAWKKNSPRN